MYEVSKCDCYPVLPPIRHPLHDNIRGLHDPSDSEDEIQPGHAPGPPQPHGRPPDLPIPQEIQELPVQNENDANGDNHQGINHKMRI